MELARLLSPEDFGLTGMVTLLTSFLGLFRDAGLFTATVQPRDLTHEQISTLFWINVAVGVSLAGTRITRIGLAQGRREGDLLRGSVWRFRLQQLFFEPHRANDGKVDLSPLRRFLKRSANCCGRREGSRLDQRTVPSPFRRRPIRTGAAARLRWPAMRLFSQGLMHQPTIPKQRLADHWGKPP
jgi:Polysaccharide biosynthesis protein